MLTELPLMFVTSRLAVPFCTATLPPLEMDRLPKSLFEPRSDTPPAPVFNKVLLPATIEPPDCVMAPLPPDVLIEIVPGLATRSSPRLTPPGATITTPVPEMTCSVLMLPDVVMATVLVADVTPLAAPTLLTAKLGAVLVKFTKPSALIATLPLMLFPALFNTASPELAIAAKLAAVILPAA